MYGVASGVHMPVHMRASMPEFVGSCYTGLRHNLTSVPGLLMSSVQSIRRFAQTSTRRYETVTLLGLSFMMCSIHQLDSILRMV